MPKQVKQKKLSKDNTGKNNIEHKMYGDSNLQDKMRRMMR
jgi:hypothetical protein